ncbi:mixed lineage kinase domain-like protein [Mixophyes fleayi]|uniref:mixed lineage kinase domain-like protein n=1 Tax=Mixophyes fleayi TaxID=3061075 RepID=UPI003F4E3920
MELVKGAFSVAKTIYDQCDNAENNKKRCNRLKKRVELLLVPVEKLRDDPDKSKELEATLSDLLINLQNAERWVNKYTRRGWWRMLLQASGIEKKFAHINDRLSDTAQVLHVLINVEGRAEFLRCFNEESVKRQNQRDIIEDLAKLKPLIESDIAELRSVGDKVDSTYSELKNFREILNSGIARPWDIKEIRATDLKRGDLLGEPGLMKDSHSLYLGEYHKSRVVIKVLKGQLSRDDVYIRKTFNSETQTMKKYESPNILRLYGICIDNSSTELCYSLIIEFCEKGTLRKLLKKETDLTWERRVLMALDAARALYRLHQTEIKAILHGNLSSSKFLVDGTYCVKLSGFELSKTESSMRRNPVKRATDSSELVYIAPETLQDINAYDKRSEIYSLGVVIYEIATGEIPLQGLSISNGNLDNIHQKLCAEVNTNLPTTCPPVLRDIISRSLGRDPGGRPSAGEIADILIAHLGQTEP